MIDKTDIAALREALKTCDRNDYRTWPQLPPHRLESLLVQLDTEHLRAETLSKSEWKMAGELGEQIQRAEKAETELAQLKGDQVPVAYVSDEDYQEICWTKYGQDLNVGYGSPLYAVPQKPVENEFLPKNLDRALTVMGVSLPESQEEFNLHAERWMQRLISQVISFSDDFEAAKQKPVVLPKRLSPAHCNIYDTLGMEIDTDGGYLCREDVIAAVEAAGGIVKDGE